MRKYVKITLII